MKTNPSEDNAPRENHIPKEKISKGLVLVNTGDGKGKSTAAFGTALRAVGSGMKVAVVQFIKGEWKTGEEQAAKAFGESLKFFPMGEGFTWDTKDFQRDVAKADEAWQKCVEVLHDEVYELVIFDEINYCMQYGFVKPEVVIEELGKKPKDKHVFLTGGGAPEAIKEFADLVTEMKCIKHPYNEGIVAQRGIEF